VLYNVCQKERKGLFYTNTIYSSTLSITIYKRYIQYFLISVDVGRNWSLRL